MDATKKIKSILLACPEFREASSDEIEMLTRQAVLRHYVAGQLLWTQGELVSAVYIPHYGVIQIATQRLSGDTATTALLSGKHLIGTGELFAGLHRYFNEARALSSFDVVVVSADSFMQCVNASVPLLRYWLQASNLQFMRAVRHVDLVMLRKPEEKLYRLLADFLLAASVEADGTVIVPFSQEIIGNMASLSRQVTCRVMADWCAEGYVETAYQRVIILNRQYFVDEVADVQLLEGLKKFL